MSTIPTDDPGPPGGYGALTARRLKACWETLAAVAGWLGEVVPSPHSPWLAQRQTELILRAIQSMQGTVLLAERGLRSALGLARVWRESCGVG